MLINKSTQAIKLVLFAVLLFGCDSGLPAPTEAVPVKPSVFDGYWIAGDILGESCWTVSTDRFVGLTIESGHVTRSGYRNYVAEGNGVSYDTERFRIELIIEGRSATQTIIDTSGVNPTRVQNWVLSEDGHWLAGFDSASPEERRYHRRKDGLADVPCNPESEDDTPMLPLMR